MAAIEKICELSGEYPSWLMYGYKRNHIQVMPHHRKRFRGADATLHLFKDDQKLVKFEGGKVALSTFYDNRDMGNYEPPFHSEAEYRDYKRIVEKWHYRQQYWYALEVKDEHLQGEVDGIYAETTYRPKCVIRRLKRMLRNPHLAVIYHDCTYHEWLNKSRDDAKVEEAA